ncbi:MAG: hypothetical protein ACI87E_001764 [Mariniblastus sp.]|jgi:hypothetical protein
MMNLPKIERDVVQRLSLYSLTIATSYIIARTVGDSLFLSRVGNQHLAVVFLLAGCSTALIASCWYLLTRQVSISKSIQFSGVLFAAGSFLCWALLPSYHHSFWLLAAIYLLAEIKGCINAINIVSALNTKLGRDASKTSWAAVGLAAPVAAVVVGSLLAFESNAIELRTWLLIGCGLDLVSVAIGWLLGRTDDVKSGLAQLRTGKGTKSGERPVLQRTRPPSFKAYVCSDKFRLWIAILISCKVVVLTFVSFEWKSSVNSYFSSDPDRLVRFFGIYYGLVGIATVATQYFLTRRLLMRRNLSISILLMPFVLLGVGLILVVGAGVLAGLVAATLGKSLEVWRRSVHDTTLNSLYTKIRRQQRRSVIAFNSALIKPTSEVAASCVIFMGAAIVYRPVMLVVSLFWIIAAIRLIRLIQSPSNHGNGENVELFYRSETRLGPRVLRADPAQA